jgi:hypothetical protein
MNKIIVVVAACWLLSACSPEIGSEKWCKNLEEKPKGEWTANEAKDYTKNCIFK